MADTPDTPLNGPAFDALWTGQIEPQMAKLERGRRAAMRTSILIWSGFGLVIAAETGLTGWLSDGQGWIPNPYILCVTLLVGFLVGIGPLNRVAIATRTQLLQSLSAALGVSYVMKPPEPPGYHRLIELGLLPQGRGVRFEDLFQGRRSGVDFSFCGARMSYGAGPERAAGEFAGQVFRMTFPHKFLGTTVVLRQSGRDRFHRPKTLERVGLEDPQFETAFEAYSDDQVEARAILTPAFMERLVALERAYGADYMRCAFQDGDLLIVIEGGHRFEGSSMFTTLDSRARAEAMAADIQSVLTLIDGFMAVPA